MSIEGIPKVAPAVSAPTRAPEPTASKPEPGAFGKLVHGLGAELERGEKYVKRVESAAWSGHTLGANELLALQVGVYRYSEAVDLASKLVERATSGVKTVLQGQ